MANTSLGLSETASLGDGFTSVQPTYGNDHDYESGPRGPFYGTVFAIFLLIILLAVTGNSLVIFIVLRFRGMRNSVTNFYIMNVALSDLFYTIVCVPITVYLFFWYRWHFGNFLCKTYAVLQTAVVQVTCTTLTVMTVDRYYVIISPLTSRQTRTISKAAGISVAVWISSLVIHFPAAFIYELDELSQCNARPGTGNWYMAYVFFGTYFVPLSIISVCYGLILSHLWKLSRNGNSKETSVQTATKKWKTTRIVLAVILLFALCWLPIHVANIWQMFQPADSEYYKSWVWAYIHTFSLCLAYANSCINPFVYALAGASFRKHINKLFPCIAGDRRDLYSSTTTKYSLQKHDTSRTEPTIVNNSTHL